MPPTSPPASAKKGMPALAWVGIGCGGIIVLAIVAAVFAFAKLKGVAEKFAANPEKAGAELIVSMNPDLKMLSQDEQKGTMTIRTKDGQEMTLSYKDIAEGKITMTDAAGNTTSLGSTDLSQVPAWVPKPDGLSDAVSLYHTNSGGKISGQFSGKSAMSLEDLKTFFESAAEKIGFASTSATAMEMNGTSVATLEYSENARTLKIVITEKRGSPALINIHYTEG